MKYEADDERFFIVVKSVIIIEKNLHIHRLIKTAKLLPTYFIGYY